jgi:RHS repeat-associated protein
MKRIAAYRLSLAAAIFTLATFSSAQVANGAQPFGSFGGGPFDSVNLGNLNVNFTIQTRHKAGRGTPFTQHDLVYNSSIWTPTTVNGHLTWTPTGNWGWSGLTPAGTAWIQYSTSTVSGNCGINGSSSYTTTYYNNYTYHDFTGGSHLFGLSTQYTASPGTNCPPPGWEPPSQYDTSTVDGYTLTGYGTGVGLTDVHGNAINVPVSTTPPTSASPSFTDRNGNIISMANGIWTDTLNHNVLTVLGGAPNNTIFSYTAPSGATAQIIVSYVSYTVTTAFSSVCTNVTDYNQAGQNLVDTITMPDGSTYTFAYEKTTPTSSSVTGRIAQITLPTGGTINYAYGAQAGAAPNCADGMPMSFTRTLNSKGLLPVTSVWGYSRVQDTGQSTHWTTTITDPTGAGNQTAIDFEKDANSSSFFETQRSQYSGSVGGTLLKNTVTCWNETTPAPTGCATTAVGSPIWRKTVFTYLPSSSTGVASETDFQYNVGGATGPPPNPDGYPVEVDNYDWGTKASGAVGALIRKTLMTYGTFNQGALLLSTVTIEDSGNNVKASTTYSFDQTTPAGTTGTPQHTSVPLTRGNVTTIATKASGTVTLYRKIAYYDTGNVLSMTDQGTTTSGGPNTTVYNYSNATATCGNTFPSSITEPLMSTSPALTWDCNGGVMTTLTDENGQTSATLYTTTSNPLGSPDPAYWRPFGAQDQTMFGTSSGTSFTYPSTTAVESSLVFNGSNSVSDRRTKTDGFGRVTVNERRQGPTATNYDSVQTNYNVSGFVNNIVRPYSAAVDTLCSGTCPKIIRSYDPLGRLTSVSDAGGGVITYTYPFNDVHRAVTPAPTGENSKRSQSEYNALGWLLSVCEITSATGSGSCPQNQAQTGFLTKYSYDLLGDITIVTQNAQAASGSQQTRTYTYDMLGRLTSELNPETGSTAITYVYDSWDASCGTYTSAGDPVEKKDAMGNVTCMKYDALHRMTDVTYPSGTYASVTDQKHFVYDTATVNSTSMVFAKTRLAEAYTGTSASKKTDLGFSYSARGEVTDVWESTPNSSGYYHVTSQYWANKTLNTISGLTGLPMITYGADGEGRPSTVSAASGQNPVTAATYNVASQITGLTFGSADSDSYQYDPNTGRMTQYTFNMGTGPTTDSGALTWNANGTLQQLQITDNVNTANSQTCTFGYDDLVRITSANCGSVWSQTFGFDPFGNLSKTGSAQFLPTYTGASGAGSPTNQYYQITGGAAGTSNYYDTNGNLKNDVTHAYTWDADGNNLSTDGTTVTMIYDALDRMIEQTRGSSHTQIVYGPYGMKLALMNGQTLVNAFIKLHGGARAVYSSSGLVYYRHADHLGSSRLATTPTRTKYYDVAYAPYGEDYNGSGTQDLAFTDENQDTVKGGWSTNLYDFMLRGYRTAHGRWTSPDPAGQAAVDPANPQSWNRYAYALNNPLAMVDLLGDDGCYDQNGNAINAVEGICQTFGGTWLGDGQFVGSDGNIYAPGGASFSGWADGGNGAWVDSDGNCHGDCVAIFAQNPAVSLGAFAGTNEATIVEEPGNPGTNIDLQVANRNSDLLSQAVNNTGVQNLKNPCTTVAWLIASATVGTAGAGVAGSEAVRDAAYDGAFWLYQKAINAVWKGIPPGEGIIATAMFYGKAALSGCNAMAGK